MKTLDEFLKEHEGYHKIDHSGGSLITCYLYNPETRDLKRYVVDDMEYNYGHGLISDEYDMKTLEYIRYSMDENDEVKRLYNLHQGNVDVGATIEVVKGRKYPAGTRGKVTKVYDYLDRYGRFVAEYCLTNNGLKVSTKNVVVVDY